jgi:hypothetical protein
LAQIDPDLFRRIVSYAIERYPEDRATYHVSAELSRVPDLEGLSTAELPRLLDQFDARQVLHVTFGSVLDHFDELIPVLADHEETHYAALEVHFVKHLEPFAR